LSLENFLHSKGGWEVTAPVYLEEHNLWRLVDCEAYWLEFIVPMRFLKDLLIN
jgi:hypothetical protein